MKISIDTQHDSHDDIKKVIKMLQHFVGDHALSNYDSNEPVPDASPGLFNMFGDNSSNDGDEVIQPQMDMAGIFENSEAQDSSSDEESEGSPSIIPY